MLVYGSYFCQETKKLTEFGTKLTRKGVCWWSCLEAAQVSLPVNRWSRAAVACQKIRAHSSANLSFSLNTLLPFLGHSLCQWHCLNSSCCPERECSLLHACYKAFQHFAHCWASGGEGQACPAHFCSPINCQMCWACRTKTSGWKWAGQRCFMESCKCLTQGSLT